MNERIKKLAEQAGFCIWTDEEWNPGDVIDWAARYDKEFEKFAELIVKECCEFIEQGHHSMVDRLSLSKNIKQHFGVE